MPALCTVSGECCEEERGPSRCGSFQDWRFSRLLRGEAGRGDPGAAIASIRVDNGDRCYARGCPGTAAGEGPVAWGAPRGASGQLTTAREVSPPRPQLSVDASYPKTFQSARVDENGGLPTTRPLFADIIVSRRKLRRIGQRLGRGKANRGLLIRNGQVDWSDHLTHGIFWVRMGILSCEIPYRYPIETEECSGAACDSPSTATSHGT